MPRAIRDASIHIKLVKDIASRFADGRLSAAKLAAWNEDEVAENLISVRGIGPVGALIVLDCGARYSLCAQWTVHMFSIFSLRQPDVLGVGDLGLQKVI